MVFAYSTRTAKNMDQATKDLITNYGVPLEIYTGGIAHVGANNRKSLERFSNLATLISTHDLPLPPSPFIEFVADQTTGKSKRDYRIGISGKPGDGKSYTCFSLAARYAMEMGERFDKDPFDYFSLENCALLQDDEGVTSLMDSCGKQQAVIIDDAGVSASNRRWQSEGNIGLGAIMQTCRTKRWFLIYNAPNNKYMDNQIRDLLYTKGRVYKPCHSAGFNVVKLNSTFVNPDDPKSIEWKHRFSFENKKINFYAIYSPDFLDPYVGMIAKYDALRDTAGDSLIHDKACNAKERKNPVKKYDKKWDAKIEKHYSTVCTFFEKGSKFSDIKRATGLNNYDLDKMMAKYKGEKE